MKCFFKFKIMNFHFNLNILKEEKIDLNPTSSQMEVKLEEEVQAKKTIKKRRSSKKTSDPDKIKKRGGGKQGIDGK